VQNDLGQLGGRHDRKGPAGKKALKEQSNRDSNVEDKEAEGNPKKVLLNWCSGKGYKATFSTPHQGMMRSK
jgi:hypothetical protein